MKCNEIVRTIGIDVHKDSYSLSTFNPQSGSFVTECTTSAAPKSVVAYVDRLRKISNMKSVVKQVLVL